MLFIQLACPAKANPRSHTLLRRTTRNNVWPNVSLVEEPPDTTCPGSLNVKNHNTLIKAESVPYSSSTQRHPPSKGESTVALSMDPAMKPIAIPTAVIPLASPRWPPENHMPTVLTTLTGIRPKMNPNRKVVAAKLVKPLESPLSAPAPPARRHAILRTRLTPNRSPRSPPAIPVTIQDRNSVPQMPPIWTRVKSRSVDISLNSTGMHMRGIAFAQV